MIHNKTNIVKVLEELKRIYVDSRSLYFRRNDTINVKRMETKIATIDVCIDIIVNKKKFKTASILLPTAKVVYADNEPYINNYVALKSWIDEE